MRYLAKLLIKGLKEIYKNNKRVPSLLHIGSSLFASHLHKQSMAACEWPAKDRYIARILIYE